MEVQVRFSWRRVPSVRPPKGAALVYLEISALVKGFTCDPTFVSLFFTFFLSLIPLLHEALRGVIGGAPLLNQAPFS